MTLELAAPAQDIGIRPDHGHLCALKRRNHAGLIYIQTIELIDLRKTPLLADKTSLKTITRADASKSHCWVGTYLC